MTGKPINLNKVRKARAKAEAKAKADANAVKFGRTRAERAADEAQAARDTARHDGHKRDDD